MKTGLMIKLNIFVLLLLLVSCKNDKLKEVTEYFDNGNLKSIEYFNTNGEQEGESKYYKENGTLDYSTFYNNGEIVKSIIYYDDGKIHYHSETGKNDTIRKVSYHRNGKIEMIGNVVEGKRVGWWKKHNSEENLIGEYEFLIVDNKEHLNQFKVYDKNGKIKEEESSFFTLTLSDTVKIGKNTGRLNYYSISNKDSERHLYVIIDNEYEGGIIKKDTFYIENGKNRFGVYAYKSGSLNVKGTILDRELYVRELNKEKDSFGLEFKNHYKYFEKEVYVQ